MEEYNTYDAFANTQKDEDELFEDVASCENNKEILRRLKENDPELKKGMDMQQSCILQRVSPIRSWDGWGILLGKTHLCKN